MTLTIKTPAAAPVTTLSAAQTDIIADLVLGGDLSKMNPQARVNYYVQLCNSLNLNPHTQPFQILKFQGKEIMYATKSCTEQLRKLWGVSVTNIEARKEGDVYLVVASVTDAAGRRDAASGVVSLTDSRGTTLTGENLANAFMKAETKAKRRATLSICGLGMLDESELDTMPQATKVSLPPASEIGTSAEVVEPAPVALAKVEGELLTAATRRRILLGLDVYDVEASKGEGAESRLLDSLDTMTEAIGLQTIRFMEKQPKKKVPKTAITAETTASSASLVNEFRDRPTVDGKAPTVYATPEQKKEIERLAHIPAITRPERTTVLLNINRLDTTRAGDLIGVLSQAIEQREGGAGAAVAQAA